MKLYFYEKKFNAGIYDFFQIVTFDGNIRQNDEIAAEFGLNPNSVNFIKYIKLTTSIPINWITDEIVSTMESFLSSKE